MAVLAAVSQEKKLGDVKVPECEETDQRCSREDTFRTSWLCCVCGRADMVWQIHDQNNVVLAEVEVHRLQFASEFLDSLRDG